MKGAQSIASFLQETPEVGLVTLSLSNNNFGSKGANLILRSVVLTASKLKELKLQYNGIKNDFLKMAEACIKEAETAL